MIINWGTIQALENNFYTKVSRIKRLTEPTGNDNTKERPKKPRATGSPNGTTKMSAKKNMTGWGKRDWYGYLGSVMRWGSSEETILSCAYRRQREDEMNITCTPCATTNDTKMVMEKRLSL